MSDPGHGPLPADRAEDGGAPTDRVEPPRNWIPVLTWAVLTSLVGVISHLSNRLLHDPQRRWAIDISMLLGGLVQFDGHHYLDIASNGYTYTPGERSSIAWFPLYPLAIRAVGTVVSPPLLAAVIVTATATLVALVLLWRWLGRHGFVGGGRITGFALLALFPYSWYLYGVVYADALFLALVLGALLLADEDRRWTAALLGGLATATRPTGLALVPALMVLAAVRDGVLVERMRIDDATGAIGRFGRWLGVPRVRMDRVRPRTFVPLASLAGIACYAAFLLVRFDAPFAFVTNQAEFHGRFPVLKLTFFSRLVGIAETPVLTSTLLLQAVLAVSVACTAGWVSRRVGFAYAVLVLGAVLIPAIGTHDFMGTGRYLLLAFPSMAVIGERLARRPGRAVAVVAVSGAVMLAFAFAFSRSVYLA